MKSSVVLIGLDHAHLLVIRDLRVCEEKEPIDSKTTFGWVMREVVSGRVNSAADRSCKN